MSGPKENESERLSAKEVAEIEAKTKGFKDGLPRWSENVGGKVPKATPYGDEPYGSDSAFENGVRYLEDPDQ